MKQKWPSSFNWTKLWAEGFESEQEVMRVSKSEQEVMRVSRNEQKVMRESRSE